MLSNFPCCWTGFAQVGVKVSGFAPRIAALESVLYMIIDRIKDIPKPHDAQTRKEAAQVRRGAILSSSGRVWCLTGLASPSSEIPPPQLPDSGHGW